MGPIYRSVANSAATNCTGASLAAMIAGHTDMPVGTAATSAVAANGDDSMSGTDATTGGRRISRGSARRVANNPSSATNPTAAASRANDAYEMRSERVR